MATKAQIQSFIRKLSALAVAEAKKRTKWVLPSVCIAQAALETGWGTSSLMTKANAYFGIKATSSWKGKVYNSKTKECYDGATMTDITACFRAYDSLAESVADYFDLITGASRYAEAVCNADAKATITAIKNGGYATDPTYVDKVMAIVNNYNLTQYDDFAEAAKGDYTMEMRTLKKGMSGEDVRALQILLKGRGYNGNMHTPDGKFGSNTQGAVKLYQKAKGLTVDGIAGEKTLKSLMGV